MSKKKMVTSPSRTVSRPRLKPLPCRPLPLITVVQVHLVNLGYTRITPITGYYSKQTKQKKSPSVGSNDERTRNEKNCATSCAFRLQWRHSSRFIKRVLFRSKKEEMKEKREKVERGVVVDEKFFPLVRFLGGKRRRAGYHSSLSPGGLQSFKL